MPRKSGNRIRPIRSERDHRAALAEIEKLWDARPGTPAHDRLDVLAALVDAWEGEHHPIEPPDPVEAIRFRMEQRGLTRRDLEPFIGGRGRVAEVLAGKRRLTLALIRRLRAGLGVPAQALIREPRS
jgi:HTH-type transcriptional regulator/antitoxin HigA